MGVAAILGIVSDQTVVVQTLLLPTCICWHLVEVV